MIRKLFVCPYFGDLPEWMPLWLENFERLRAVGYDVLIDQDEGAFQLRVEEVLGIEAPPMAGTGNVWDFRAAFGLLYADEIEGYDFWGHTDFDVVYGRVENWVTDEFLDGLDVHSNHATYQMGAWSLYRNIEPVNSAFLRCPEWRENTEGANPTGWVEGAFSEKIAQMDAAGEIRKVWTSWQARNLDDFSALHWDGERLMEGPVEVAMAHFRRTKVYPEGCR